MGLSAVGEVGATTEPGRHRADSKTKNDTILNPSDLDQFMVCHFKVNTYIYIYIYMSLKHIYIYIDNWFEYELNRKHTAWR